MTAETTGSTEAAANTSEGSNTVADASAGEFRTSSRLAGEVVLAVGCGSRYGQLNNGMAAVRAFLAHGARILIIDRETEALDDVRTALLEEFPEAAPRVLTKVADVVDEAAVQAAADAAVDTFGSLTVLHYNVGIVVNGGFEELERSAFQRALDVNLTGAFSAIKHVVGHMRAAGHGSIITVSSVGGMRWTGYDYPAYAASKAGLIELTKTAGLRYAREGIRANSIAPGLIETPLIHTSIVGHHSDVEAMLMARHAASPTGKMGQPENVADAAVFLASPESSYVNATVIPVDGGIIHQSLATQS